MRKTLQGNAALVAAPEVLKLITVQCLPVTQYAVHRGPGARLDGHDGAGGGLADHVVEEDVAGFGCVVIRRHRGRCGGSWKDGRSEQEPANQPLTGDPLASAFRFGGGVVATGRGVSEMGTPRSLFTGRGPRLR
ncbi:hypothetical protein [Streptomyces sp. NPDC006334]|uniref:hypothetical protein n=1 Tax=Streptomyces sp. NPDC006334 TaxID=3156754 RepID=UPI00339FF69E